MCYHYNGPPFTLSSESQSIIWFSYERSVLTNSWTLPWILAIELFYKCWFRVHNTEKHSQTPTCDFSFMPSRVNQDSKCFPETELTWTYYSRSIGVDADEILDEYNFIVLTQCACTHKGIITGLREASSWRLTLMAIQAENPLGKMEKQDWRWSQDQHRTQKKMQDERVDTIGELWHKLWGKWGLPDEKLNTWTGTATDAHRQDRGSLPELRMNSVTLLSHYSTSSPSPLLSFNAQRTAGLSLQLCKPIFHPLSPQPPLYYPPSLSILGMAVEILAQAFRRLPGCQTEQKGSFKRQANSPDTHTYHILTSLNRLTWECEGHVLTKNSTSFFSLEKRIYEHTKKKKKKKLGDTDKNVLVIYRIMLIVKAVYAGSKALGPIVRGGPKPHSTHWS